MKVVYFYSSLIYGSDSYEQRALAAISIRSVRRHMPGVKIVHLTDHRTKTLDDVDEVLTIEWKKATNRADAHALVHGEVLYLDTDTVITKDLSSVLKENFQIAVAVRDDDTGLRYNGGVIFCRDEHVWRDVAARTRDLGDAEQAFNEVLLSGKYKVFELPNLYNYTPPDVAVYHFKGPRKLVMLDMA